MRFLRRVGRLVKGWEFICVLFFYLGVKIRRYSEEELVRKVERVLIVYWCYNWKKILKWLERMSIEEREMDYIIRKIRDFVDSSFLE